MNSCREARERLIESIFGEAEDSDEARLSEHLRGCSACREEEAGLLRLRERLADGAEPVSSSLEARLRAAVPSAGRGPARIPLPGRSPTGAGRFSLRAWLRRPVPAYAALAAVLLVALAVRYVPGSRSPASAPRRVVLVEDRALPFVPVGADQTSTWIVAAAAERPAEPARSSARDSL